MELVRTQYRGQLILVQDNENHFFTINDDGVIYHNYFYDDEEDVERPITERLPTKDDAIKFIDAGIIQLKRDLKELEEFREVLSVGSYKDATSEQDYAGRD